MKITVVGLGVSYDDVSLRGYNKIKERHTVVVKTRRSPTYCYFDGIDHTTCDDLYDGAADFDALNAAIVSRLAALAEHDEVVYCVPGDGVTDGSVVAIKTAYADVDVIPAAGQALHALAHSPSDAYSVMSAYDAATAMQFDTEHPLVIYELADAQLAGDVKLNLSRYYGENTPVRTAEGPIAFCEIDRLASYGDSTAIVLLPVDLIGKQKFVFADLIRIMAVLTGAEGCPWDKAQTHASIRGNLVEEAYEAVDAIDSGDIDNMIEEMGDILLQAVFHAVIAEKEEEFDYTDVLDNLCTKLLFRHPHVFGTKRAEDADGALDSWEAAKAVEKSQEKLADSLDSIPAAFPQTLRAVKVAKRAAKAGIGADIDMETYRDMTAERLDALCAGTAEDPERALGECVYAVANMGRLLHIDAELCAKKVNDAYTARFRAVEARLNAAGVSIYDATEEQVQRALVEVLYRES